MKLIVGLGNPGEKYERTRHNLGFLALDELLRKFEPLDKTLWDEKKDLKSNIKYLRSANLILAKPTTFMNESGIAVAKIINYFKIEPTELIVVHDDIDLPFGKSRVRFGGSAGGHHGVESIIQQLKTDKFLRIRLGIGSEARSTKRDKRNLEDYVLAVFEPSERSKVKHMIKELTRTIDLIFKHGIEIYMSRYHSK